MSEANEPGGAAVGLSLSTEGLATLARQAGFRTGRMDFADGIGWAPVIKPIGESCNVELLRFAELVIKACAAECERIDREYGECPGLAQYCRDAILEMGANVV